MLFRSVYIQSLKQSFREMGKTDIPIIKAVRVKSTEQVLAAEKLSVDYLLLDAFTEEEDGGSGRVFNHALIPNLEKPYLLAGATIPTQAIKPVFWLPVSFIFKP